MTTRDHARPAGPGARTGRLESERLEPLATGPALPERLAAARERKGVDLVRAERDTKIRARYLSALERGDYRELPGAVYTKGFLRNYAIYLNLDPEDVLRQWRRERGEQGMADPLVVPPRPIAEPARPLTFSPSIIVAALMTFGVIAFGIYLSVQLLRYAKPPELSVSNPAQAVLEVDDSVTTFRLEGLTTPGATVTVSAPGRDQPYRVTALADGSWSVDVELRRGRNQFDISATNPETGKQTDTPRQIVITVPFLVIQAPTLTVSQPVDGTTYENGAIPIEGMTANATSVTVSATYLGPPGSTTVAPSPAPTPLLSGPSGSPGASTPPNGTTVDVADDGTFTMPPLELTEGRWAITVTAVSDQGKTASLTRTVTVAYKGVNLVITLKGGNAWMKVWVDGAIDPRLTQAGRTYHSGDTIVFTGLHTIEVRTGNSGSTFFTLNGVSLGALGKQGIPETWLFAPPDAPTLTNRR
jgi:cytoskeletal protein RodZ